jgi:peptidoglycan hydrolase CwlO-like protein
MKKALIILAILIFITALTSCSNTNWHDEYVKMEEALNETQGELYELEEKYEELKTERDNLEWQVWELQSQIDEYNRVLDEILTNAEAQNNYE